MSITARGGYQIIDFHGIETNAETPVTIPGIYEQVKNGLMKLPILWNFVSDAGSYWPIYPAYIQEANPNVFTIKFSTDGLNYTIMIQSDDSVRAGHTEDDDGK